MTSSSDDNQPTKQCKKCQATLWVSDPELCERCDLEELEGFGEHLRKHSKSGLGIDVTLYPSEWEMVIKSLDYYYVDIYLKEDMVQLYRSVKRQVIWQNEN